MGILYPPCDTSHPAWNPGLAQWRTRAEPCASPRWQGRSGPAGSSPVQGSWCLWVLQEGKQPLHKVFSPSPRSVNQGCRMLWVWDDRVWCPGTVLMHHGYRLEAAVGHALLTPRAHPHGPFWPLRALPSAPSGSIRNTNRL